MNAMWFKNIFSRKSAAATQPLFDEAFLRRLERLSLQAQRTLRGRPSGGEHLSRNQLPATIFNDHRPYSAGDDYRYVDWNAYAHQEEIFVRLGEIEQNIGVHLLLDISRSMAFPAAPPKRSSAAPKIHMAKRLVAAIGYLALAHHDRLHVAPFGASALPPFGPAQGKGRLLDLLRFVESAEPNQPTALTQALGDYARRHTRGGLLVICSDLLVPEGLEQALRALPPPRWQTLVLHILDPFELKPELRGPVELQDAETGQRLPLTLDSATLAAYRRNVAAWQERIASTCAQRGATYAQVLTDWPLERQVIPYLRARRILR
jgi:uncharacterized protein (DUF58 family)